MSYTLYPLRKARLQRSELAVPGSNATMIEKAAVSAADYVFLDCEDAVAPPDKEQARKNIIQALNDIDWKGKRVVVIGSGATAMTLVPALANEAAHVTMVQRSPTWVVARPSEDPVASRLRGLLPQRLIHAIVRWKQVLLGLYFFNVCRSNPERAKKLLLMGVRAGLGKDAEIAHLWDRFSPR